MIVCHCNVISSDDIRDKISAIRDGESQTLATPGAIFKACGKRPKCGGCMPVFAMIIEELAEEKLAETGPPEPLNQPVQTRILDSSNLTGLTGSSKNFTEPASTLKKNRTITPSAIDQDVGEEEEDEGQCEGYRIPEQIAQA